MYETTTAQVVEITPLSDSIIKLLINPHKYISYIAGQYLQVFCQDIWLSFSIANAPSLSSLYELYIRHEPANPYHQLLFNAIKQGATLELRLPFGNCHLNSLGNKNPLIFIAGGTGFAPIKAMLEQLLADNFLLPIELYWVTRSQNDLYALAQLNQWRTQFKQFSYYTQISSATALPSLDKTILERHHLQKLATYKLVLAGPIEMVLAVRNSLIAAGIKQEAMYSDMF